MYRFVFITIFFLSFAVSCVKNKTDVENKKRPNVIIILTDDQGYGDFGFTGNPLIKTPNMDALAARSAKMNNFYVSPVCAPTRACLMTGRYNYRTGVVGTFLGRAMMDPRETTLAEVLKSAGYATAIFGKWHLGDNYPMRPQEQGFDEVLVHRGGGIGQESDPPGGEGKYTDPILFHNGKEVHEKGYCTDIYFNKAVKWIEKVQKEKKNFFLYLPTNAPHSPFKDVPQKLYNEYKKMNLNNDQFPQTTGHPLPEKCDTDRRARIYAMITNIDDNMGMLFHKLDSLNLMQNTLVLFFVDNGPNGRRYVAGMKGKKTEVYEGGIRSPLLLYWPERLESPMVSDRISAHIDIFPTVLDACGIPAPDSLALDGKSILPLLKGENTSWADRYLVLQAHRTNIPKLYNNFAIRSERWKLLNPSEFLTDSVFRKPELLLYDMQNDPLEMKNVSAENPQIVERLKKDYETWFEDVSSSRPDNFAPLRIYIGTKYENPVTLTRQDWRKIDKNPWLDEATGYWLIKADKNNVYDIHVRFRNQKSAGKVFLKIDDSNYEQTAHKGQKILDFKKISINKGKHRIEVFALNNNGEKAGVWQIDILAKNIR